MSKSVNVVHGDGVDMRAFETPNKASEHIESLGFKFKEGIAVEDGGIPVSGRFTFEDGQREAYIDVLPVES